MDEEEKLKEAQASFAEKEKAMNNKIENVKQQQQKLLAGETDAAVLKLNEELKRIIEQGKEKQERLKKDTEEMEKVFKSSIQPTYSS